MAEVRLENVVKLYGKKKAIRGVSFTCHEGEFFSILGPTGAGKTTILKMIAGIEKVTSGKIFFNGREVNDLPPQERNVSMAFETYNLYPHLTVYENIAFPLRAPRWGLKLSPQEERKRVQEIADFLGLGGLLDRLPQHLSGGQKQRVSLARALVRRAEVYLLDEPIAHLDARLKFSTQTLLKELAKKYSSTIIYVTHDFREALALSDRMVVLRKGLVEQEGTPEEIYYYPQTDFVGRLVGDPPMNLLDGEVFTTGDRAFFRVNDALQLEIDRELFEKAQAVADQINGKLIARLGIRPEHIRLSAERTSDRAFQLPIYAIIHENESSIVTFNIKNVFLYVRTEGFCKFQESDRVWLEFDPQRIFFFKKGVKLTGKGGSEE
ncbi:ABC transporter ATP-binding protein [Thermatribacter velox]|uniref:ABC transporter ATP-binding protein n=1 Tax=Thermatribacter velox TaxID=3039681 RepID=A0ABZ2YCZ4_9BACT